MKKKDVESQCATSRSSLVVEKPFTAPELQARHSGETCLELAKSYQAMGNTRNALLCCETGLKLTVGITRPLMIRDQLHDLSAALQRSAGSP